MLAVVFMGLAACFVLFQYGREKRFKEESLNASLQIVNNRILDKIEDYGVDSLYLFADREGVRITIMNRGGDVLFDSFEGDEIMQMTNHSDRPEIISAIDNGTGYIVRRLSSSTKHEYFYSALNADSLVIRTAIPYTVTLTGMLAADLRFVWVMLSAIVLMSSLGYLITRRLGENIIRLREFARKADKGEIVDPDTNFSNDELGDISKYIVKLYSQLQKTTAERDSEHEVVLRQEQEKIRIKRQLTNNINHELKTPVAAIQGYLETILNNPDMNPDMQRAFIEKGRLQVERLHRLLQDISAITRMDEASHLITGGQKVVIQDVMAEICADVALLPFERRLNIHSQISEDVVIEGNSALIASIFRNLTDNALAYSMGNDIWVKVIDQSPTHYTFSFEDNGIGVSAEHLSRLFERFYRIDKGRSRKQGGTGLGLSIVRNAVVLHGGEISVSNCADGGLRFVFTLRRVS